MDKSVLDLSKKCLKKVPKQDDAQQYRVLILDDNELQKIDNIDSYSKIEKVPNFHYTLQRTSSNNQKIDSFHSFRLAKINCCVCMEFAACIAYEK